jgi:hypothetical protein
VSASIALGATVARGGAKATLYESTVLELVILRFNSHKLFVKERQMKKMAVENFEAPVAKVVPVAAEESGLFGFMVGEFKITGDIESPVFPAKRWKRTKK